MSKLTTIGWKESVALPALEIEKIHCKVDTGAKTSSLHAYFVEPFEKDQQLFVRFGLHPVQNNTDVEKVCVSPCVDKRIVKDSGGHTEERYVIKTLVRLGDKEWEVEFTLTDRDTMQFRMLLGREALKYNYIVDSSQAYILGE